jgi:hypothetical protein
MLIYSTLIYIVSLALRLTMNVTINNRCTNIVLTSPVYFIKDTVCHVYFPQEVNSGSIMKVNFKTSVDRCMFGGALLYHLQRKEDTLISTQLLVIWEYESDWIYSHALLIEHESTFSWSKDDLKRLYDVYNSRYNATSIIGRWMLDDNTMLKTKLTIFEQKDLLSPRKPLWISPNK